MKKTNPLSNSQLKVSLSSEQIQELFLNRAKDAILSTATELLEEDMERLCGKAFERKTRGLCHRAGSEHSSIVLAEGKRRIRRPRARKNGKEVELPSLTAMQDQDLLDREILSRMVKSVATRNYESIIGGLAEKTGISKSSVSRAFVRASKKDLDKINGADLSGYRFVALLVDGTNFGGSTQVVAVGITDKNEKVPLGLKIGDTENAEVVKDLLSSIMARGFTFAAQRILAVLDGGKALKSAVKALWGTSVLVQRCWLHKLRNLQGYIPEKYHKQLWWRMKKMMTLNSYENAKNEYHSLREWLFEINCDAKKSLEEAGEELLSVHQLALTGEYRNSLSTTNIIESLIGVAKAKCKNVKNWKIHPKASSKVQRDKSLRWVASAIEQHKSKMRKLRGGKEQIDIFVANLNNLDLLKMRA